MYYSQIEVQTQAVMAVVLLGYAQNTMHCTVLFAVLCKACMSAQSCFEHVRSSQCMHSAVLLFHDYAGSLSVGSVNSK